MDEFLKMDIFFVVTTLVVAVFGIFGCFILWRISRILGHVEHIAEQASREAEAVREDLDELRADLKSNGGVFLSLFRFLGKLSKRSRRKRS